MSKTMNLSVRLTEPLTEFVSRRVGADGDYDNASEYVRDLIRRDREREEQLALQRLKLALQDAFAEPDDAYAAVTAEDVIARNRARSG